MANGFRAQLTRMFGLAFSAGARSATRELNKRTAADKPTTEPSARTSTRAAAKPSSSVRKPSSSVRKPSSSVRKPSSSVRKSSSSPATGAYAGDFTGVTQLEYTPMDDGKPDPGEVVWAWVPFEEDAGQGKDRPVLVIARHSGRLLGLMLTSKDHDRDHDYEAKQGRYWLDIGAGAWDRENRPSEVRLDRILQLDPGAVRREGAVLDRSAYDRIAVAVRRANRW